VDGIHDLGGAERFGPVEVEPDEPVFHHEWERRTWGLTMSTFVRGLSNGGQFRHSIERMDPAHYLTSRYYEHWLTGTATRAVETGLVTRAELEQRAGGAFPLSYPVVADEIEDPGPNMKTPAFAVGDRVRVRQWHPRGHTRCPAYVRGKEGTVVRIDAVASVPDVEAHSAARRLEPVYCVRFDAAELWRDDDPAADSVHIDLWECYLT
jgi:nitrile hydratase